MKTIIKLRLILLVLILITRTIFSFSQLGAWIQKANYPLYKSSAIGFTIGTKGYIGTGNITKDFWEYDPASNVWTQKADFGGSGRGGAVGFSIGTKGYIGTGSNTKDFWEYDPGSNVWTQKADFGGNARSSAVGFSIGNKGYIGTGIINATMYKDFWEYDPGSNIWIQKSDFGGITRGYAVGFSIGLKGYIGTGNNTGAGKDFWEYDPASNVWTQKADFGGSDRWSAAGFSIGPKGYIGTGSNTKDFWEYNPASNDWTQKADFGGNARSSAVGFSIGNKGYIGTGINNSTYYRDFWEYDPCPSPVITQQPISQENCIGSNITLSVTAISTGILTYQWKHNGNIILGAINDTLIISNFNQSDTGRYRCIITNTCTSTTSSEAILTLSNWMLQNSTTTNTLFSVHFPDKFNGFAVGDLGIIIKTNNGGRTWEKLQENNYYNLNSVHFTDANTGYACGWGGVIIKSTNGGLTWTTLMSGTTNTLKSISFVNPNTGFISGENGIILKTSDAGANWSSTVLSSNKINSITFPDINNGFCVGFSYSPNNVKIFKTTNGGNSWSTVYNQNSLWLLNSIFFTNSTNGYSVGYITAVKTTNSGSNWSNMDLGIANNYNSVHFPSVNNGYVVGDNGKIYQTKNSGVSWRIMNSSTSQNLQSVHFPDTTIGFTVGNGGVVIKWRNTLDTCTALPATPDGDRNVCNSTGSTFYHTHNILNSDTYQWSLIPSSAGIITGSDTLCSVNWNSSFIGIAQLRVQAYNNSCGGGQFSNPLIILRSNSFPNAFSLINPLNGSFVSAIPQFQWNGSTGASYYQLYIDGVLKKDNIQETSYSLKATESLSSGMHFWNIISSNGCITQSNETWSFRVDATPPTTFNLLTPTNNAWTSNLQPTFQWSPSLDAGSGLAKYQLWIDGTLNRDNISTTVTSTTCISSLTNGPHLWMIKAIDNVGNVRTSTQTWSVKIDNYAPIKGTNNCLNFNGTNSYISVPNSSAFNVPSPQKLTIEAWIRINSFANNNVVLSKGNGCCNDIPYQFGVNTNQKVYFHWYQTYSGHDVNSTFAVAINTWTHIAVIIDGGNAKFYINGQYSGSGTISTSLPNNSENITIGKNGTSSPVFNGQIDEVRFWNIARQSADIDYFKDQHLSGFETGLMGYWRFNEGSGSIVLDRSLNSINGSISGAAYSPSPLLYLGDLCDLKEPSDGKYLPNVVPLFSWSKSIDSGIGFQKYQLIIDGLVAKDNLSDSSWTLTNPLSYGQHTWFVKGFDSLGNNQFSYRRSLYIDNANPFEFNLNSPPDSAIVDLPTPDLSWQATTDSTGGSGLRKYQLWINNTINRDSIRITQTTVSPANALNQGAYTWFVRAIDNVGNARQSKNNLLLSKYYNFSTLAGSYDEISGTQLIGNNADNVVSALTNIGFNFNYAGITYSNFSVNSNGAIFMGILGNTSATNNLTSGSPRPIIAPLWDDLKTGTSGSVSYLLTGVAGTRVLTIQFKQMKWNYNATSPAISFQVKLYETNNKIEFIYKQEGATPSGASASIGITAVGTGTSNFLSLNSSGTTPVISSQIETTNLSTCPATGQIFRFEYIEPPNPNSRIFFVDYEPPSDFTLIEPADNSTIMNCRPIFRWHASHDAGTGIKKYELIISGQPIITLPPSDTLKILDYDLPNGIYTWFVKAYDGANAFTSSDVFNLILNVPLPQQAATPTGAASVCQGASNVSYSTTGAPYASTYQWTIAPSGCGTITGSTNTATVNYEASFTGTAQILVKGHNSQGYGPLSPALYVTVHQQPVVAAKPTGPIVVCQNATGTVYSTTGSVNAMSYEWAVSPSNAGNIMGSTASATVNWNVAYAGEAKIKVRAINPCGQSAWSDSLDVTVNPLPGKPAKPAGTISLCKDPLNNDYMTTGAPNTLLYHWHILPDSAGTITWNVIGTTATVDWNSNFYGFARIFIVGNNECGDGPVSDTLVVHVYSPVIGTGTITGTSEVCLSQQRVIYTVTPITHAESYIWTLPPGASGTSTTDSIAVNYSSSATSGHFTVEGQNFCGTGPISSYYVNMNQLPFSPENISGMATVQQGQTSVLYTVPFIPNATSYDWLLPLGASITSGSNSNNIGVSFSPTASSGAMQVRGQNLCGYGPFSPNFPVIVNMASQLQLSNITLTNGDTNCYNALQTLTVAGGGATFIIQNGGYAKMIAGQQIHLLNGSTVQLGGCLWAYITPNNTFCGMQLDSFINASEVISEAPKIELNNSLFKVYPNPTTGLFTVEIVNEKSSQNRQIKIYNILGRQLYHSMIPAAGKTEISFNDHPKGVYFITVWLDGRLSTCKIVKQ